MVWLLVIGSAFAGKWEGVNGDVVAERDIAAPAAAVYAAVSDLRAFGEVFPDSCADEWVVGAPSAGLGARATVRYDVSMVHRRLPAEITRAEPDRVVDVDHAGKKGFTTRFELAPTETGGTHLRMTTFLSPPPWPFRPAYFRKVQPAWRACQAQALDGVAARVAAAAP
jgi:uncharacterized protein YndB with AHSA1/START domain